MSEIADVVQIIRVEFEGMELAMKVGSASIKTMQKAAKFLVGLLSFEKSKGKTGLKKMLLRGGDMQVFQFEKAHLKEVQKLCKKYGILYSLVPKLDKNSTRRELLFHAEATPRMNLVLQKMKHKETASIKTMDTFLAETDEKQLDAFNEYLKEEKNQNPNIHAGASLDNLIEKVGQYALKKGSASVEDVKKDLSLEDDKVGKALGQLSKIGVISEPDKDGRFTVLMKPEDFEAKMKRLTDLNHRMRQAAIQKNASVEDITIAKKLIESETETHIMTRIPGTWGENARYIWIDKADAMEIHGGKTILTFLDKDHSYILYDKQNKQIGTIRGADLYRQNYSKVDKSVREKYKKLIHQPTLEKKKVR